jgi:hypothetical protein
MELETSSNQTGEKEALLSLPLPKAWWGRVIYALYITVMPALAFWGTDVLKPEWQSGEFSDYLALLLTPEASLVFLFLLAYSIICYLLLLIAPTRFSQVFFIRFGIYTGVLLAFQYSILAGLFLIKDSSVSLFALSLLWIFPVIYWMVYRWAAARWTARNINKVLLGLVPVLLLIGILIAQMDALLIALAIPTIAAPFWSLLLSFRAALWLFKNYDSQPTFVRSLGIATWFVSYVAAWRFDILKMYELYAALPKEPPDCYIATAAAHGHPRFVQAWTAQRADGKTMQVNRQLQRLKCAELALMTVHPRLHGLLRHIYDVVGKYLASKIHNPFLADTAYLLLKPWEWSARLVLKTIVPEMDTISNQMYIDH